MDHHHQERNFGFKYSFTVNDGGEDYTAVVGSEEARVYDQIIYSNLGVIATTGLEDDHLRAILSKSRLSEPDIEHIWQLATTLDAQGLPGAGWTQLEVYVALHFVQRYENLSLDQMAGQFAGPIPPVTQKVRRRSSYAMAGKTVPSAALPRTLSLARTPVPPVAGLLRHSRSDASATVRLRGASSHQDISEHDDSSTSQAGLEVMDIIGEDGNWHEEHGTTQAAAFRIRSSQRNHLDAMVPLGAVSRGSSILTDTAGRAERLANLIQEKSPQFVIGPVIEAAGPWIPQISTYDRGHAHDILVSIRTSDSKDKDLTIGLRRILKSKKTKRKADEQNWEFNKEELSRGLEEALRLGHVGVAEALLEKGADVNCREEVIKHKVRKDGVRYVPTNLIKLAASTGNVDMVRLLASHRASATSKAEALDVAVKQNEVAVVEALLRYDVDPNAFGGSIFQSAINSQNPRVVRLLLRARQKVLQTLLNVCLPIAVEQGKIEIVSLLVLHGADVNEAHALALRKAAQSQRIDLLLAIMKGNPTSDSVSSVFEDAFLPNVSITVQEQYHPLYILLCGGASGDPVAEVLVRVVRAGHCRLARMLIVHGASLQYKGAAALKQAVRARDVRMLKTLSLGKISRTHATDVFTEIPQPFTESQTYELMSLLISKGATGIPLDKALVSAVEKKLKNITMLLLDHKASADYNDAQALQITASAGDLDTFHLILNKGKPQPQSMRFIFPLVPPDLPRLRYDMMKSIIEAASTAGIPTPLLDVALVKVVDSQSPEIDLDLINLIVVAGADVNCLGGKPFQTAAKRGSIELLELLVRNAAQASSLSSAVPIAMRLVEPVRRRKMMAMLLDHGTQGPAVVEALTEAIGEKPLDEDLILNLVPKADVNHRHGRALCKAIKSADKKVVSCLIDLGHPNHQSRLAALQLTLEPATADRPAKLDSLLRAGIDQKGLDRALVQEIRNGTSIDIDVIKMLLHRKASCNYDEGKSVELAVSSNNHQLLRYLVLSKCDSSILAKMLPLAMQNTDSNTRYACMALLLGGGAKGDEISRALVHAICESQEQDPRLVELLIRHGARVDYSEGKAIKHAVSTFMNNGVLELLLGGNGAPIVLASLVPLAMSHAQMTRLRVLRLLLEKGAQGAQLHLALIDAVKRGPSAQQTIDILLKYNASVDYQSGEAVRIAAAAGHSSILDCLLQRNPNPVNLPEALSLAMQTPAVQSETNEPVRIKSVRLLTHAGVTRSKAIHNALIQAVSEKDHALVEHLIKSGGDPSFRRGKCVIIATEQADIESLVLLVTSSPSPVISSAAFAAKPTSHDRWRSNPKVQLDIDKILLDGGAAGPAVDRTFFSALKSTDPVCDQFVDYVSARPSSLDVDFEDGKCLCMAARRNMYKLVQILLAQSPNQRTLYFAFLAIFESNASEEHLINLSKLFLERPPSRNQLYFSGEDPLTSPLYQALHRHSGKPMLLQHLLDSGCPADSQFLWEFDPEIGAEETSALLWLLCQTPAGSQTDKRTCGLLLERGAGPDFRTSGSGRSPLIIAAESSQPDITLQLLEAQANANVEDKAGRTPLQCATRVGSFFSMQHLLDFKANPDDESLHIAARGTNVSTVKLLLDRGASVDCPGIRTCNYRTPLGELCRNACPSRDPAQFKDTLNIFAKAKPDLTRLTNRKSLMFLALDNDSPFVMTTALLRTFQTGPEDLNADFNILREPGGVCYSLTMYVRHFKCTKRFRDRCLDSERRCCNLDTCPAPDLEELLREFGCRDRFWIETARANQPLGVCGPPTHIVEEQKRAESLRKQQEEKVRLRAEEEAQQEAIQADLDRAAQAERRRERARLAVLEEKREADANEERRRLAVLDEERQAAAREEKRKSVAIQREHMAEMERKRELRSEREETRRHAWIEEENHIKRKNNLEEATMEKRAKISAGRERERMRTIDKLDHLIEQVQISGIGGQAAGRILGEVEDGGRLLM